MRPGLPSHRRERSPGLRVDHSLGPRTSDSKSIFAPGRISGIRLILSSGFILSRRLSSFKFKLPVRLSSAAALPVLPTPSLRALESAPEFCSPSGSEEVEHASRLDSGLNIMHAVNYGLSEHVSFVSNLMDSEKARAVPRRHGDGLSSLTEIFQSTGSSKTREKVSSFVCPLAKHWTFHQDSAAKWLAFQVSGCGNEFEVGIARSKQAQNVT